MTQLCLIDGLIFPPPGSSTVVVNDMVDQSFKVIDANSGHSDIALAVHVVKQIEHIVRDRKYDFIREKFKAPSNDMIGIGKLIRFSPRFPEKVRNPALHLVHQRNDLVHKIDVNKFENKKMRKAFIDSSNVVISEMWKASRPMILYTQGGFVCQGLTDDNIQHTKAEFKETNSSEDLKREQIILETNHVSRDYGIDGADGLELFRSSKLLRDSIIKDEYGLFGNCFDFRY